MMDSHPAESLLLGYIAGTAEHPSEIDEHLAFCTECRAVVNRLRDGGLGEAGAFDDVDDVPSTSDQPSVPAATVSALAQADHPEPAQGELWRVAPKGRDEMLLVWIRRLHSDGRPAVVPVSFDPEFADQYDLIVPAERSPLGVDLAFHTTAEGSIDRRVLVDRLADLDVVDEIEAVRRARREGRPVEGLAVGAAISSIHDERVEYRKRLTDLIVAMGAARFGPDSSSVDDTHDELAEPSLQGEGLSNLLSDALLAELVREIVDGLSSSYPQCRLLPSAWPDLGATAWPAATLVNIDVFVRLVLLKTDLDSIRLVEASRAIFDGDLSVSAVCFTSAAQHLSSWLIDRAALIDTYFGQVGVVQPASEAALSGSVIEVLTKYFDRVVDPFRVVVSTTMDQLTVDPGALAVTAGAAAVDRALAKASGYKIPGKRPGYERLGHRRQLVTSIVEQALQPGGVDVRSALGESK